MATRSRDCYRTVPVAALGHRFYVETDQASLRDYLDEIFAGLPRVTRRDAGAYRLIGRDDTADMAELSFGDEGVLAGPRQQVLATLLWHINATAVERTTSFMLLHAAAAARDGDAVVLPAPMESGKTTLVAGLLRAGWTYLTDEATAVSFDGAKLIAYPKALSVDAGSWEVLADLRPTVPSELDGWLPHQWQVSPMQFPQGRAMSARPRLVVFPGYVAGGGTVVTPMTRADALLQLTACSFSFHRDRPTHLEGLAAFVAASRCYRLQVDDLEDAVQTVAAMFEDARQEDG